MKIRKALVIILLITSLISVAAGSSLSNEIDYFLCDEDSKGGPYVDKVVYQVIGQDDQQVLALQNDEIDLIGDMVDPSFLPELESSEYIEVAEVLRNGYGYMTINTEKYPLNITAFRRAIAFALDKEKISEDVWDGLSLPLDSCIPRQNPFSVEGKLPYTYYEDNVALGNQLLDDTGFIIPEGESYRRAPDGSEFDILVECASSSNIAIEVGALVAEALQALHINAVSEPTDFYEYLNRLYFHGNYDIVFVGSTFTNFDVDWLAYEYWSEYADEPYWNFPNFRNASYDSWREQLLYSTSYDDVLEAATEMQKVWVYQCPVLVCYQNFQLSAYRSDKFEGHKNDVKDGIPSWWTNQKVHLKAEEGGPFGGTFTWSTPLDVDTFNFMTSSSAYTMKVLNELYDSLLRSDWNGNDLPWLATSYLIETHEDNPDVPAGHSRFTFDLIMNATWSDGVPLTAEDVAYTMNYYLAGPGNPYGADLTEMTAAYAPGAYQAVFEFSSESFWHLHTIGYKPIIPKHVFESIGPSGWNTWSPDINNMVVSGPFRVTDHVPGEFVELTKNPYYFYQVNTEPPEIDTPDDVYYVVDTTGHTITWSISGEGTLVYTILRNLTLVATGFVDGPTISVSVDGLPLGVYNYSLIVVDFLGQYDLDTVMVYVVSELAPVLSSPDDVEYMYGTTGNNITWSGSDNNPSGYRVYRNDTLVDQGAWSGEPIVVDIDSLGVGGYNYTLEVYDEAALTTSDTVYVTVNPSTDPGSDLISYPTSLGGMITIGSITVIIIIIILSIRSRGGG